MGAGKLLKEQPGSHTLADLPIGARCVLDRLDLPADVARRLMELGFLPGNEIVPTRKAPGGGPRVYRVDGSEVACAETPQPGFISGGIPSRTLSFWDE